MNCVLYKTATGAVVDFFANCIRSDFKFTGSNKVAGYNMTGLSVMWTTDTVIETKNASGLTVFTPDHISAITDAGSGPETVKLDHLTMADAISKLNDITNMTFQELDDYIDANVVDLPSAKIYIKKLSKAVLASMKLIRHKL